SLRKFVERDMLSLLLQCRSWQDKTLRVGTIALATNRINIELAYEPGPAARLPEATTQPRDGELTALAGPPAAESLWVEVETCAGWLVARIREEGWLGRLDPEERRAWSTALAGLYKLAGVELVREQIAAALLGEAVSYDITPSGMTVWLDRM